MKILYVSTVSNTVNLFLIPHIKILIEQGHKVDVAFNVEQEIKLELLELGCVVHQIGFQRLPLSYQNYVAYKKLKNIIEKGNYDMVHTHTPVASACVRLACKNLQNVKVIYTAHGFHFFKGAPLINWLIYYPIEFWLAKYTDILITINNEDYSRASKSFKAGKVEYVSGVGINTTRINGVFIDKSEKRRKIGIPDDAFVLLSVGELNKNKNHGTVIRALAKLKNPNLYYVICGEGELRDYLEKLVVSHGLEQNVKLLGFRTDVHEMYKIANIFIFPSFREGLSVSLMEAMASGTPVICSNIRGNRDLIEEGKGGYLIAPNDVKRFEESINKMIIDLNVRNQFINENLRKIKLYEFENVLKRMRNIYSQLK